MTTEQFDRPLSLESHREGPIQIVRVRGSATMDQAEHLHRQLVALLQPAAPHLIIDLSELDFISSLGIGAIVAAHLRAVKRNGSARIVVHPGAPIAGVFQVTQLDQRIPIHGSLEEARSALSRATA